mmetsp:Transcript_74105/g.123639  ORF Transcript_74105/g.123639 Transcript_74105/m.123639 type:complete len:80 (+) Transcript_74105:921-1160(+)
MSASSGMLDKGASALNPIYGTGLEVPVMGGIGLGVESRAAFRLFSETVFFFSKAQMGNLCSTTGPLSACHICTDQFLYL